MIKLNFKISELKKSEVAMQAADRLSVSGVQEKFPAVVDRNVVRLAREGERSTHILKPAPWDDTLANRKYVPVNEYLTMQIASRVYGIQVAENNLCLSLDNQLAYITKRFDILPDGSKMEMEDFASVLGRTEKDGGKLFKYSGSYEDIAGGIKRFVSAWMVDTERFFDLVVFNYIVGNGDAHLKNFSLLRKGEDYRLSPAYDLINTNLHVNGDDFGLDGGLSPALIRSDTYESSGHPCRQDFESFGLGFGLQKNDEELNIKINGEYTYKEWDMPTWHERLKPAYTELRDYLKKYNRQSSKQED